jgi:uncharacterized protein
MIRRIHRWWPRTASRRLIILMLLLSSADSFRQPSSQLTAAMYVASVQGYQRFIRPITSDWVRCRFRPTCSRYSIEAVRVHGIRKGLVLTARRLVSCRPPVPMGTENAVPRR